MGPFSEFHFENAVIYLGKDFGQGLEKAYVAEWKDGNRHVYGESIYTGSMQKLQDAIECARNGGHPVCAAQTAKSHLEIAEALARMPIHPINREQVEPWELGEDHMLHIKNLEEIFKECFEKNQMPSEIGVKW